MKVSLGSVCDSWDLSHNLGLSWLSSEGGALAHDPFCWKIKLFPYCWQHLARQLQNCEGTAARSGFAMVEHAVSREWSFSPFSSYQSSKCCTTTWTESWSLKFWKIRSRLVWLEQLHKKLSHQEVVSLPYVSEHRDRCAIIPSVIFIVKCCVCGPHCSW